VVIHLFYVVSCSEMPGFSGLLNAKEVFIPFLKSENYESYLMRVYTLLLPQNCTPPVPKHVGRL
jgi:hypothetical protein